ncbi:MAG TPA: ABC transporter permease [Gammaproteobacteria bacterium]|nr:ABC transporter permease [Gammaproteobacteria bacterium]
MGAWLAEFRHDLRWGLKLLRKNHGFTLAAVLTLALGIGATSAIFTVLNSVVLRPLPFPNPEQLVWVMEVNQRDGRMRPPAIDVHQAWREQSRTLTQVGGGITGGVDMSVSGPTGATRISLGGISLDTLSVLGVKPIVGRWFRLDEPTVEGDTAESLVISYRLWQQYFGGDPDVVGKTIPGWDAAWGRTIIGVMPSDFWVHPSMADVDGWFAFNVARIPGARVQTLARLKPGVSYAEAEAELGTIAQRVEASLPGSKDPEQWRIQLEPLHAVFTSDYKATLYLLLGAVGFVLLIAAVNVANLQLSRSVTRQSELATRVALGAGRGRMIRLLVTENVLLALVGGALGIAVAYVGKSLFVALAPDFYPPTEDIAISPAVLLFTFGVSVLTGILAGLVPAFRASRPDLQEALKQSARGGGSGIRQGLRRALVVMEVALALVLLVGAGLMINSYARVMRVDMGFRPDKLLTMEINLSGLERYRKRHNARHFSVTPQVAVFYEQLMDRLKALPGVRSVGMTTALPPRESLNLPFRIVGEADNPGDNGRAAQYLEVSEDYFETMGVRLLRGRVFTRADNEAAAGVVVINETLARQFFGGKDPLGQVLEARINQGNRDLTDDRPREIVGVVSDTRMRLQDDPVPMMYVPYRQHLWDYAGTGPFYIHARKDFAIRTDAADPMAVAAAVRQVVADVDASVAVDNVMPMRERLSESAANERFWLRLLGLFAGLAVFLATIGIYAVIAYSVEQRAHEFGIRSALGAGPSDIVRLVVREGLFVTVTGLAIGIGAAFALTRLIANQLYGVTPMDPPTIAAVALLLTAVAMLACVIPARHAAKVDPLRALRIE